MSTVEELAAMQGPDPIGAAEQLGALLDLASVGLTIRGARVVGRGSRASADIYLSDGTEITFETLRDIANPTRLALEIAACTGATPSLKAPQAIRAVSLLRALAEHHVTFTADEIAADWATSYLQTADVLDIDMADQSARWAAFTHMKAIDPVARARENGTAIAAATIVLRHSDGSRLVRCGWYRDAIRAQDSAISPQDLAHRMERVGWQRRGSTGRIKACQPLGAGRLSWTFYTVPKDWAERA